MMVSSDRLALTELERLNMEANARFRYATEEMGQGWRPAWQAGFLFVLL
jgi:hypothetical protein